MGRLERLETCVPERGMRVQRLRIYDGDVFARILARGVEQAEDGSCYCLSRGLGKADWRGGREVRVADIY